MSNTSASVKEDATPDVEEIDHERVRQELLSIGHHHDPGDMMCPSTGKIAPEAAIFVIKERPTHRLGEEDLCNACYGCITDEQAVDNGRWTLGEILKWRESGEKPSR